MPEAEFFTDEDGVAVAYYRWMPATDPKAIVLIAHGASEHGARYDRFASFLAGHGFAVFAQDHRGHGNTAKATGVGVAGPGGWDAILRDEHELNALARKEVPGVPVILLGHSMGSFIAQGYVQRYGDEIDGLILSGSAGSMGDVKGTLDLLDAIIPNAGADSPAPAFSGMNDQFEGRTEFDWLSRDQAEVDKYIADPMCGNDMPLSLGFARGMLACLNDAWANEDSLRRDLPVLFITGEMDPVSGNAATVRELEERWKGLGVQGLVALYYPEARHELLNETNRDEVQADVLAWMEGVVA